MILSSHDLTIQAGPHHRRACPVCVVLPGHVSLPASIEVVDRVTGHRTPAQVSLARDGQRLVSWIEKDLAAGHTRTYRVGERGVGAVDSFSLVDVDSGVLEVRHHDRLVTSYHYGAAVARPFLYPLLGPGERAVTRHVDLAQQEGEGDIDHMHHRSVWVAHGDVNGTDNWSEAPGHGRTLHQSFLLRESGPVFARFAAAAQWVSAAGEILLDDTRCVTVYRLPDERVLLDVDLTLMAAHGAVRFGDTKEGGLLSVRVAPSMTGDHGGLIETSYGALTEAETWGRPAHWCDYSGAASEHDRTVMGIAVMDHPLNPRHPTHWHVRDYGLMTANPFGISAYYHDATRDGSLQLPSGGSLPFRYRLLVHAGRASAGDVRAAYLDYACPPLQIGH